MSRRIAVEGRGLHAGAMGRVTLTAMARGPEAETTLNGEPISRWRAIPAERSTAIVCGDLRARTVEHLFAALAATSLRRGVEVRLEGEEPPILDGGAAAWMDAIQPLGSHACAPWLAVAREGTIEIGKSTYSFVPADRVSVAVELESDDARIARRAAWGGDRADFRARIAPARTFCFAHELEELSRRGLASHVSPESVVVIGPEILAAGRPFEADEPARHKLLDLVGDLFLYGGPPRGSVTAVRPGHSATHEAMRAAALRGILVPVPWGSPAG